MKKTAFFCSLLIFCTIMSTAAHAQLSAASVGTAQNLPSVKWKSIETDHFTIIYPVEVEKDAQRMANTLEKIYPHAHKTIQAPERKTPVLLFTGYPESNGMATYAPRRSEWYNTPPQTGFGGVIDWYQTLGLHEYRHILQFDSMNTGMFFATRYLLGEEMLSVLTAIAIPPWYFEGDAVVTETLLSNAGRGRTPSFDAELRALMLNGRRYGFYQADLGSYKNKDPLSSPYLMGYFLETYMRRQYGADILNEVNRDTSWLPVPYMHSFFTAMRTADEYRGLGCLFPVWMVNLLRTGNFTPNMYEQAMDEVTELWQKQLEGLTFTGGSTKVDISRWNWTTNHMPQYLPDGTLSFLTWDFAKMPRIAKAFGSRSFSTIAEVMPSDNLYSAAAGRLAWAESIPDIRYGLAGSSDIFVHRLSASSTRRLTHGARYYAPSLSSDGSMIAAVEFGTDNNCALVLLDADTGAIAKKIPSENNAFIQTPHFTPDGQSIVFCAVDAAKGKALREISVADGAAKDLTPWGYENILNPVTDGKYIYYSSEYSGIDNIYAIERAGGKRFQVTSRRFGAYAPALSPDGKKIAFSDLDADGYRILEMDIDPSTWTPIEKVQVRRVNYCEPLLSQEAGVSILTDIPQTQHTSKNYYGVLDGFKPHSWYPWVDTIAKSLTIQLNSRNLLGSFQASAEYDYNWNESTHTGIGSVSYGGLFPVFDLSGSYGNRYVASSAVVTDASGKESTKTFVNSWTEKKVTASMTLPFNFSRGLWTRSVSLTGSAAYYEITDMTNYNQYKDELDDKLKQTDGTLIPLTIKGDFINAVQWRGDIVPRWGQVLSAQYTHSVNNQTFTLPGQDKQRTISSDYDASVFSARGLLYFPGISIENVPYIPWLFRNHALYFEGAAERQISSASGGKKLYRYESQVLYPRGYAYEFTPAFAKGSVNYAMPLLCPDMNVLWLFYLKRVYIIGFFDIGMSAKTMGDIKDRVYRNMQRKTYDKQNDPAIAYRRSAGYELMFEIYPFNKPLPLHVGYRYARLFDGEKKSNTSLVFSIGSPM